MHKRQQILTALRAAIDGADLVAVKAILDTVRLNLNSVFVR